MLHATARRGAPSQSPRPSSQPSPPPSARQVLPYVTVQPPPLPIHGLGRVFGWFRVVVGTSDVWLLHSAGLDALVQQKCLALGLQVGEQAVGLGTQ